MDIALMDRQQVWDLMLKDQQKLTEALLEIERLRAALIAITKLDGYHDLCDAQYTAETALSLHQQSTAEK